MDLEANHHSAHILCVTPAMAMNDCADGVAEYQFA